VTRESSVLWNYYFSLVIIIEFPVLAHYKHKAVSAYDIREGWYDKAATFSTTLNWTVNILYIGVYTKVISQTTSVSISTSPHALYQQTRRDKLWGHVTNLLRVVSKEGCRTMTGQWLSTYYYILYYILYYNTYHLLQWTFNAHDVNVECGIIMVKNNEMTEKNEEQRWFFLNKFYVLFSSTR